MFPLAIEHIPDSEQSLRPAIREFIAREMPVLDAGRRARSWMGYDEQFSRKLGAAGFIGLMLPQQYGGAGRGPFARFVVIEELLGGAAVGQGAVAGHRHPCHAG